ncbi:MAG TPA: tetratricopeptide repeat protein [Jatrophihabitantaceae bacterium]|jgi:predicted ATPase/predicted Zn-dependent protease
MGAHTSSLGVGNSVLRLQLLGDFAVLVDGREVTGAAWRRRKARTLIKLLALAPDHVLHRDQLIEAMWPDTPSGANNLHQALFAARRALDDDRYLQLRDERLVLGEPVHIDVDEFEAAAARAEHTGRPDDAQVAIATYGGELLPGDRYEPWSEPRRDQLRRRHHALVIDLAVAQLKAGEPAAALQQLEPVYAADPLDEHLARLVIRAQLAAERRPAAVSTYRHLVESLRDELGVVPAAETQDLGRELSAQPDHAPVATPHNLPLRLSSFVGRERELHEAQAALRHTRLLTLTGTGGCGKTRLSIELGELMLAAYPGGVYLVELAPLATSEAVPRAVAATLGVQQIPDVDPTAAVAQHIRGRLAPMLLVLDNCEHLVDSAATVAHQLLTSAPNLAVVATSRQPLLMPGEVVWRVPSLSLPDDDAEPQRHGSVRLLLERAAASAPGFELTDRNQADVVTLCRRLDGLPLALELAAARLRSLPVRELVARLDDRFALLVGGSRVGLTRQQTLRATVDWSYDLLTEPERILLRRLAVFAGSFTLAAAEQVCPDALLDRSAVAELLSGLVDRSLVTPDDGAVRYRLLETIREYAIERLGAETTEVCRRRAQWVLALAERAEPELAHTGRSGWFRRLSLEQGNLRATFDWLIHHDPPTALRLAGLLWRYWLRSGRLAEGLQALRRALDAVPEPTPDRARALMGVCGLSNRGGRISAWDVQAAERVAIFTELGDPRGISHAQYCLGVQGWLTQDFDRSRRAFDAALEVADRHGLEAEAAAARYGMAAIASLQGRVDDAEAGLAEVLDRVRELADTESPVPVLNVMPIPRRPPGLDHRRVVFEETAAPFTEPAGQLAVGYVTANLGSVAREAGDYELARDRFERALRIFEDVDDDVGIATALSRLGNLAGLTHEMPRAHAQLEAALRVFRRTRDARSIGMTIGNLGYWIAMAGDMPRGRAMVERSEAMFRENGDRPGQHSALSHLGALALVQGDAPAARRALGAEVEIQRVLGTRTLLAWSMVSLAEVTLRAGDDAAALIDEARDHFVYTGRPDGVACCDELRNAL